VRGTIFKAFPGNQKGGERKSLAETAGKNKFGSQSALGRWGVKMPKGLTDWEGQHYGMATQTQERHNLGQKEVHVNTGKNESAKQQMCQKWVSTDGNWQNDFIH
jgi:hypothetical protein